MKDIFDSLGRKHVPVDPKILLEVEDQSTHLAWLKLADEVKHKYPRTPHLPWSPGATNDDRILTDTSHFNGMTVVVSEKLDGENCTIGQGYTHARSLDSKPHESRSWVKGLAGQVGLELPDGWRLCGENLFAQHSIAYDALPSYFILFSVWDEHNNCLSWDDTEAIAQMLGIHTVPVLYKGPWDDKKIAAVFDGKSKFSKGGPAEGYVVRNAAGFSFSSFDRNIAKFVRVGHVQTGTHWMQQKVTPNKLMKTGTKTPGEKEDEEIERLSRPAPKNKPPRTDLRREHVKESDPDTDADKSDTTKDPDLSLNYKKVGEDLLDSFYGRVLSTAVRAVTADNKPLSTPSTPPAPSTPPKPGEPAKKVVRRPGEVWQPEGSDTWSGKNNKGESQSGFKDEDAAKAYAKGEKKEPGEEDKTDEKVIPEELQRSLAQIVRNLEVIPRHPEATEGLVRRTIKDIRGKGQKVTPEQEEKAVKDLLEHAAKQPKNEKYKDAYKEYKVQ
ncbi:MAG: RNA ligase family protein, partial [Bacteroidota bacterium]